MVEEARNLYEACMTCQYRRDGFDNGRDFPIYRAEFWGISLDFCAYVGVCSEHLDWLCGEWTITPFDDSERVRQEEARLVELADTSGLNPDASA